MVEQQDFRRVLGHFTTGVAVVAACAGGQPYGFAVNSFVSVSLDPPLVAFCVAHTSTTWPLMRDAEGFAISLLGAEQEHVCRVFATKGADRFAGLSWSASPGGHPIMDDAIGWLDCVPEAVHRAGDHDLVLVRVTVLGGGDGDAPLIFHRGRFGRLADTITTSARFDPRDTIDLESPFFPAIAAHLD
ncbi:MAG: flavin reductase family protein [Catenulispora sp.]|nr:flavin reductase family protein [Catenulispora sp.]